MGEIKYGHPVRHPHTLTKAAEKKIREGAMKEGHGLREADVITSGARRAAHGASPPFRPGDTGGKLKRR